MQPTVENSTSKTCRLTVGGMDCPSCEQTVRDAVSSMAGVRSVRADHTDMSLVVEGQGEDFSEDRLIAGIRGIGYAPKPQEGTRHRFKVPGLSHPEDEEAMRSALASIDVHLQQVDYKRRLIFTSGDASAGRIRGTLQKAGYPASSSDSDDSGGKSLLELARVLVPTSLLIAGVTLSLLGYQEIYTIPLFLLTIIISGISTFRKGLIAISRGRLDMNSLMTLAVFGAMLIGEWMEGATVIMLMGIANYLEGWSADRARKAIERLMELAPESATVIREGKEEDVPVESVETGEEFIVKPGGRIPLDGTVVSGASRVDQSPITGESVPVEREEGDELFAGSINLDGTLRAKSTALAENSTLSRVVEMVKQARERKASAERFIDRFAAVYTPIAVAIAAAIAIVPPLVIGGWDIWFYRALVVLVIACPCALVISTPVGIVAGLTAAARNGVLIKGGAALERISELTTVAFDKTGTITRGVPAVASVHPVEGVSETDLLYWAGSLERHAEHPLAAAIVREADKRSITLDQPRDVQNEAGAGVGGIVDGHTVFAGSHRAFEKRGLCPGGEACLVREQDSSDKSHVCVSLDEKMIGYITLQDTLRKGAPDSLQAIENLGLETLMLSGDNKAAVSAMAQQAGVSDWYGELLPQDKLEILEKLQTSGKKTMMVGDGVNDAPALAAADVGAAMGAAGTDIAIETADLALMGDDLEKIPYAISHSRRTLGMIRQNIAISIATKILFLGMSLTGLATLWMAVLADSGLTVLVTLNSLRLLRNR